MQLSSAKIEELASRPGVRRIAVENFLSTISTSDAREDCLANLRADARSYRWNAPTFNAIHDGIKALFDT